MVVFSSFRSSIKSRSPVKDAGSIIKNVSARPSMERFRVRMHGRPCVFEPHGRPHLLKSCSNSTTITTRSNTCSHA